MKQNNDIVFVKINNNQPIPPQSFTFLNFVSPQYCSMVPSPLPEKEPLAAAARPKRKASHNPDNTLLPNSDLDPTNSCRVSKRKKAPSALEKITNEQQGRLIDKSLDCINSLFSLVNNAVSARESLDWLDANPKARNVLMVVSSNRLPAYTTQEVLHAHVGPHAQDGFLPDLQQQNGTANELKFIPILGGSLKITNSKKLGSKRVAYCVKNVIPCIWGNYPNLSAEYKVLQFGIVSFVQGILGPDSSKVGVHVKYPELHRRMQLADLAYLADTSSSRPKLIHAKAWQLVDPTKLDKRQILIDACAAWYPHVQELTSHQYLDVLAGVTNPINMILNNDYQSIKKQAASVRKRRGVMEAEVTSLPTECDNEVEHVQIHANKGLGKSLGSVFHLPNCLPPSFVDHAMNVGIPSLPFMRDGMKKGKDRLSRIASEHAGVPFCLRKENPFLMLSDAALAFDADMLTIGNFLNAHLHAHVKQYVAQQHGTKAADSVVPPIALFDMVQSSLNSLLDGGYGVHDDSGPFVSDNHLNYGDEDHNMIVLTFFWCNRGDASTAVTWAQKGCPRNAYNKHSIHTTTGGCHVQTYGVQSNKVHWTDPPNKPQRRKIKPPIAKDDHRLAQSLRSTSRFQKGHHAVLALSRPSIQSVGDPTDYNFKMRLGDHTANNGLMGTAIRPTDNSATMNAEPRDYFTQALLEKVKESKKQHDIQEESSDEDSHAGDADDLNRDQFLTLSTVRFPAPSEIYCNYPCGHDRYLKIPSAPHLFFSCGDGLRALHRERISPIVYLAEPGVSTRLAQQVNYGFLMENVGTSKEPRPVAPGRVFSSAAVYRNLGLATGMTDSQVWDTDPERLVGLINTKAYKSEYPESVVNGRGPLVDYRRVKSGRPRLGFWTAGGGGASELIGQIAPNLQKASSLESATLEHAQKVTSARNRALLQAAQRKAWVQVYLKVGKTMVPEKEVDYSHILSKPLENSSMPKDIYMGCYQICKVTYEEHDISDLVKHLAFQDGLPADSELKVPCIDKEFERYCRYRCQMHYQFYLEPMDLVEDDIGIDWRHLRVSKLDPRRIQVKIPQDVPINASLALGIDRISVGQVYEQWVNKDKLFINFLSLRDSGGATSSDVGNCSNDKCDDEDEDDLQDLEEGEELSTLPEERKRSMSTEEAHIILRSISVGVFCRLLQVNVDSKNRIRPLVDPGPDNDFQLHNFHNHFVTGDTPYNYERKVPEEDLLPSLGVTVQRHVFPHPIRVYDVATSHFIICTGGGHKRASRHGFVWLQNNLTTAADLLIHSIVLRTTGKTRALKSWCEYSRKKLGRSGTWFLPGVGEIEDFLSFVARALRNTTGLIRRKNELHDFSSDQFLRTLDEQFKSHLGLEQVLRKWKSAGFSLLEGFVQSETTTKSINGREKFIDSMVDVFVSAGCNHNGDKLKFVCSQVCADMEEVIAGLPFGDVRKVCTGPGSRAGYAVLSTDHHSEFMSLLTGLSVDRLLMLGLERGDQGKVRIIYNKRYVNMVDVEHGGCKIGIYVPKLPGGGGSISANPRKQSAHCHPVCNDGFEESISLVEYKRIQEIAGNSILAFKREVLTKTWVSPIGILGEQCWNRPEDYLVEPE